MIILSTHVETTATYYYYRYRPAATMTMAFVSPCLRSRVELLPLAASSVCLPPMLMARWADEYRAFYSTICLSLNRVHHHSGNRLSDYLLAFQTANGQTNYMQFIQLSVCRCWTAFTTLEKSSVWLFRAANGNGQTNNVNFIKVIWLSLNRVHPTYWRIRLSDFLSLFLPTFSWSSMLNQKDNTSYWPTTCHKRGGPQPSSQFPMRSLRFD